MTIPINIGIRVGLRFTGRWNDVNVGKCRLRDTASVEEGRIDGKSECESRLKGGESCIGSLTKKGGGHVWLRWDGYGGVGAYVASGGMRGIVSAA